MTVDTTITALELDELRAADAARVYHFSSGFEALSKLFGKPFPQFIVRGEGAYLVDESGRRLLDAGHHLGACSVGHGRGEIADRIAQQARTLEYSSLDSGLTHRTVAELGERLCGLVPLDDPMAHFTSSGSEAVEAALKLARAYHAARGNGRKTKIVARTGGYHGSSYGALTTCGNPALREPYAPGIIDVVRATQPSPERCGHCTIQSTCNLGCVEDVERTIVQEGPERVAAVIAEPVSVHQAVKIPHPNYWQRLREICDRYEVLLIADEVVTGFGRIGSMFGIERWGVRPDIMTLAKGITSGYVPLGAAIASRRVVDAFATSPFVHINTNAGHPVASAAALATLDIIEREGLIQSVCSLDPVLREEANALGAHPAAVRVSSIGLLASIELRVPETHSAAEVAVRLRHACYERDVLVRTGVDQGLVTVWFFPPLIVDESEVRRGMRVVGEALETVLPLDFRV